MLSSGATVEMLDVMRADEPLAEQEVKHEHEASDRAGVEGQAQRSARPSDHRGRRPARDVAPGQDSGPDVLLVLYSESKKADGLVVQVGKGSFKLNPKRKKSAA
jgi:hypothetical protein